MSGTRDIGLNCAKARLESVEEKVENRLDRARRLYSVVERKRNANNHVASLDRAQAVRRVLDQADTLLAEHDPHRERLHEHVESNPQIEDGIYHGRVQAYDRLEQQVSELEQRIDMELAVARHRHDVETSNQDRSRAWEAPYDAVQETLNLLIYVRRHDIPDLARAYENRDRTAVVQYPTRGIAARLEIVREQVTHVETIDHDSVARKAATVNSELASDYREMVDRLREQHAALENDLVALAAFIAGTAGHEDSPENDSDWTDR